ncbi:hypothetical protein BH11MYX4_BH11MYX4_50500 [soil metagenome]
MSKRVSRRQVLRAGAALALPAAVGCGGASEDDPTTAVADLSGTSIPASPTPYVPGPERPPPPRSARPHSTEGVVVQLSHPGAVVGEQVQDGPVRAMMARGMRELTGKATERQAWASFFSPHDVVGIKVSPVGYPKVFSQVATVKEIVRGLNLAGVPNTRIIVFDRYKDYLDAIGYPALLPAGIRFMSAVDTYVEDQTDVAGYDANDYADIARVYPGDDANDPHKRRSFVSQIVSKRVTKVINVPALKDHISAGITCALKNMTYGCVNNVSRTHVAPDNWTKDFIPVIAGMKTLRTKVVLHIADALVACYQGGPGPPDATFFTFPCASLFFATDPVSLDRVGWKILDDQRVKMGLAPLAQCGTKLTNGGMEAFDERQPQHVLAAGAAGLGVADLERIHHRVIAL